MVGGLYSFMLSISPTVVTINTNVCETKIMEKSFKVDFTSRSNTLYINNQRNSSSPYIASNLTPSPTPIANLQLAQVKPSQGATVPGRMTDMPILFWEFHEVLTW